MLLPQALAWSVPSLPAQGVPGGGRGGWNLEMQLLSAASEIQYNWSALSDGNTFQDPRWTPETSNSTYDKV